MLNFLLDTIFPRQCLSCGKLEKYICNSCAKSEIEYFDPPAGGQVCPYCERPSPHGLTHPRCEKVGGLDGLFVLAHYRGIIPKAIREIKYQGYFAIAGEFADLIVDKYHNNFEFQYLVPVPLSKDRQRLRGFNQAEKLAKALALKPVVNLLVRSRDTRPQFDLKYDDRKKNLKDAFTLNPNLKTLDLKPYSFCLIDDVATTGTTLSECAKVLKKAGSKKVYGITIARGG